MMKLFKRKPKKKLTVSVLKPGDSVVFRVWRFGIVKLGEYVGTNDYPDWEKGCPVVRDSNDDRSYAIESHKGATIRLATADDIGRFKGNGLRRKQRSPFPEPAVMQDERAVPGKAKTAKPVTGIGDAAAAAVEKELEGRDEN